MALDHLEQTVSDIKDQLLEHGERTEQLEQWVSTAEDMERHHHTVLRYLLLPDIDLSAKYDDLQNRRRHNNIRIFQIPGGSEGRDI